MKKYLKRNLGFYTRC